MLAAPWASIADRLGEQREPGRSTKHDIGAWHFLGKLPVDRVLRNGIGARRTAPVRHLLGDQLVELARDFERELYARIFGATVEMPVERLAAGSDEALF
ncbi:hypothetical protein [Shinella sp.]|uniref:hypothetical protein n=1 Tax=Shinella sp. TaxID=1870904 RepID=UPI00301DAC45